MAAATENLKADATTLPTFRMLSIDKLRESKTNPRRTFDEKALLELIASVREKGVIVPLIVREQNGTFEIVAGARRYRAAKKAGLAEIPVRIMDLTDEQTLETQVIENLQREDVHPLEEAEGYARLLKAGKHDVEAIASKIGKSATYIYQRLKLDHLIGPAKKAFLEGELTAGHAVLIARLAPEDQKEALGACKADDGGRRNYMISVRDLSGWIQSELYLNLDSAPWKMDDATLLPKAGPCSACPKRAGNAPDLFPEIKKGDVCTDQFCFHAKFDAWTKLRKAELEKEGVKVVLVATEWYNSREVKLPKDTLPDREYNKLARGAAACSTTRKAIVVHGKDRGAILDVCTDRDCRKDGHYEKNSYSSGGTSHGDSAKFEKERQARLLGERTKARQRELIYRAVIEKTQKLTRQDLELLARRLGELPWQPDVHDLFPHGDKYGSPKTEKMSDLKIVQYLVASALRQDTSIHQPAKDLYATAKRLKVNTVALEKAAAVEMKNQALHKEQVRKWKNRVASKATRYDEPTCSACGCVEKRACPGGCAWSKLDKKTYRGLCTVCAESKE
jgi:ParB family chromosome partitioning protein